LAVFGAPDGIDMAGAKSWTSGHFERRQHLLEGGIGEGFDLFPRAVLDRVRDVDDSRLEAQ